MNNMSTVPASLFFIGEFRDDQYRGVLERNWIRALATLTSRHYPELGAVIQVLPPLHMN